MKRIFLALALILPLAACGGGEETGVMEQDTAAPADETAVNELSYLEDAVGKYPADVELWTTEPLASRLRALLGDQYDRFVENMAVVGPIAEEDGMVYVMGNKENRGDIDSAVLVVDEANDNIKVWLLNDGNTQEFVEKDMFVKLPSEAVVYIAGWNEGS